MLFLPPHDRRINLHLSNVTLSRNGTFGRSVIAPLSLEITQMVGRAMDGRMHTERGSGTLVFDVASFDTSTEVPGVHGDSLVCRTSVCGAANNVPDRISEFYLLAGRIPLVVESAGMLADFLRIVRAPT